MKLEDSRADSPIDIDLKVTEQGVGNCIAQRALGESEI